MADSENLPLPRWRALVVQRNTFLSISFADEAEDYECVSLRRSYSMPPFLRTNACDEKVLILTDEMISSGASCNFDSEKSMSQSTASVEAFSPEDEDKNARGDANSDVSTDFEPDTPVGEKDKFTAWLSQIISGGVIDSTSAAQSAKQPHGARKTKSGQPWRPCKGARIRLRKLLDRLMDEFDKDPEGRKFKDTYVLHQNDPSLAESQFREFVRSRLIEIVRQNEHVRNP